MYCAHFGRNGQSESLPVGKMRCLIASQTEIVVMKKIMLTGLAPEVTEAAIKTSLEKVGPVRHVTIIRDGDPANPVVIVEMDISDLQAFNLVSRVTDFWHDGHTINARLLLH